VPEESQKGQWLVIVDMLKGGQNECVGQDPVFLPRLSHMLDQMYTSAYSAIMDLSKFFSNFLTHAEDWPYLGLLHPITEVLAILLLWLGYERREQSGSGMQIWTCFFDW
jgi:hypothetical protein